jgi:dTMP kinase
VADAAEPAGDPDGSPAGATPEEGTRIQRMFGSREFFALFNVQLISAIGDWVGFFAITSLAAAISSQPEAAIALVTTARVAPGILFAPFIGVIVDRFSRKTVMVVADVVRAGVFLLLPLVQTVPGLILASLVLEIFTLMWSPAKEATVPELVEPERLTTANSMGLVAAYATMPVAGPIQFGLASLNTRLVELGFLGFLGFSAAQGGVQTLAFYFNALSFMAAALILWKWVFPAMSSDPVGDRVDVEPVVERDPLEEERSRLRRTFDEIREGWQFAFLNPVVRGVNIGLATGIMGGAMLVPLGPTFARFVIGNPNTFALFITALGLGVAVGVVLLSVIQKRVPKEQIFPLLVFGSGIGLFFGVSMSSFWLAAMGVFFLGVCAGSVYVLGFTLLQEHTEDELRGRIFATLLTLVRTSVLLALLLGPFFATIFDGFARAATGAAANEVPSVSAFGFELAIPGVRLTLWLAAVIIMVAGVLSAKSMKLGLRSGLRDAIGATNGNGVARTNHPASLIAALADPEGGGAAIDPVLAVRDPAVPDSSGGDFAHVDAEAGESGDDAGADAGAEAEAAEAAGAEAEAAEAAEAAGADDGDQAVDSPDEEQRTEEGEPT